jgi:hypothetical protein
MFASPAAIPLAVGPKWLEAEFLMLTIPIAVELLRARRAAAPPAAAPLPADVSDTLEPDEIEPALSGERE